MSNKTTEEKIDYIYNHIKTERKFLYGRRFFKLLMYMFIIGYAYYFYMYGFEKMIDKVIEAVKPNINTESVVDSLKGGSSDLFEKVKEIYIDKLESTDSKKGMEQLEDF